MKSLEQILPDLADPNGCERPGQVEELWDDGELTSTKSGELYGKRSLHCFSEACTPRGFLKDVIRNNGGCLDDNGQWRLPIKEYEKVEKLLLDFRLSPDA